MKLMDLAKRILGSIGETRYRATYAGSLDLSIVVLEDGRILCDAGLGSRKAPGYLSPPEKDRLRAATWKPPLPPEVRRAIWTECNAGEHRPKAVGVGPFQRCRDCRADLQAEQECPACAGTGYEDGTSDGCQACGMTGQLGWREAQ